MLRKTNAVMLFSVSLLSACTTIPRDAPKSVDVRGGASSTVKSDEHLAYVLVKLSPSTIDLANNNFVKTAIAVPKSHPAYRSDGASDIRLANGDLLTVTIFEAQAGGLFIPNDAGSRAGNFIALPAQQVDSKGYITVPYAGNVRVAGLTARSASDIIVKRLKNRAIDPQVVVSINERRSSEVSVLGEVAQSVRFALDPGGIRLLAAIARAGGPKYPDYDTDIVLERGSATYRTSLSDIIHNPTQNFELISGDVVYAAHDPKFVTVFGATLDPTLTSITRRVTFESDHMSLTEAIAKAGGLNTLRADARSVFVLRMGDRSTLTSMGVDVSSYGDGPIPTVFEVDLAAADGFFLGTKLALRNHDVIVASDADYADVQKFFSLFNQVTTFPTTATGVGLAAAR